MVLVFIHLEDLVFQNCNQSWNPMDVAAAESDKQNFKFGRINNFSISFERFSNNNNGNNKNNNNNRKRNNQHNDKLYDKKYTNHHNNNNRSKSPVNNNNDYNINRFQEDYVVEPLSITVKIKKNKDTSALMSSDSKSTTKKIDGKQSNSI